MDTIDKLLDGTDDIILARGKNYLREGRVLTLEWDGAQYLAEVEGSEYEPYQVQVALEESGAVSAFDCDCPYEFGPICKHLVAVFLAIQAERAHAVVPSRQAAPKREAGVDLAALVAEMSPERLRALVLEWVQAEPKLRKKLLFTAGYYDQQGELREVKQCIRSAIRAGREDGYIGECECDDICCQLDELIALAEERSAQYPTAAVGILLEVIRAAMSLVSEADTSSGYLSDTLANAMGTLEELCQGIASAGTPQERETCAQALFDLVEATCFDDGADIAFELLQIAVLFADETNTDRLTALLDTLEPKEPQVWGCFAHQEAQLVRILMMEQLEGRGPAREALYRDLSSDQARELAYRWAMEASHWEESLRLCEEAVEATGDWRAVPWLERINAVYCRTGNRLGQEETLERLLLAGRFEAYQGLKRMRLADGSWQAHYPALRDRCAARLPVHLYMELLDQEGDTARLMSAVEGSPQSVLRYGGRLAKEFPARTYVLYTEAIEDMARHANKRKDYQKVCRIIKELHRAGGEAEAATLVKHYTACHARKRAFQEELNLLQTALTVKKR